MNDFEVILYEKENGEIPVENFLDNLPIKMKAKVVGLIQILQEFGNDLRQPYSKHLEDGIFELRAKQGRDITRVLYFFYFDGYDENASSRSHSDLSFGWRNYNDWGSFWS